MVGAELAHDQRQVVTTQKAGDIVFDGAAVLVHLIHMYAEHGVVQGIRVGHLGGIVKHDLLPVLSPVGGVHQQRMREAGVTDGLDRRAVLINPGADWLVVTQWLVSNIDDDIIFLALQCAADIHPVLGGTGQGAGCALLTGTGYVMHFEHANQLILLTQGDDIGYVGRAVAGPLLTIAQHHPDRIGASAGNIGERTGFAAVPGVGVVDSAHNEWLAVAIQQLRTGNAEAGKSVDCRESGGKAGDF